MEEGGRDIGGCRDEEGREGGMDGEEGRREGGSERGMGAEGGRVGGTEGRREGRRMGTRAKPGNQLVYHNYLYPLVKPTLDYASASCDLYTTT